MEQAEVLAQLQDDLSSNGSAILGFITLFNLFLFVTIASALGRVSSSVAEARQIQSSVLGAAAALAPDYDPDAGARFTSPSIRSLHRAPKARRSADGGSLPGGRRVTRR